MKNLKILGLALVASFCSMNVYGEGKVAVGVQGGLTFPEFNFKNTSPSSQYGNSDGWLGGVFGEFGIWTITLRPELNYVVKPYTVANIAKVRNHSIEIPVLVKINPLSGFIVSPFLLVGPQWSKQIRSDVTVLGSTRSFNDTADRWDIAGLVGVGLEFNVSEDIALNFQGRYALGFRDIDSSSAEVKTRAFYALAGLSVQNAF
jgi:hypothetical protein